MSLCPDRSDLERIVVFPPHLKNRNTSTRLPAHINNATQSVETLETSTTRRVPASFAEITGKKAVWAGQWADKNYTRFLARARPLPVALVAL